jgi:hypothetical protein
MQCGSFKKREFIVKTAARSAAAADAAHDATVTHKSSLRTTYASVTLDCGGLLNWRCPLVASL